MSNGMRVYGIPNFGPVEPVPRVRKRGGPGKNFAVLIWLTRKIWSMEFVTCECV